MDPVIWGPHAWKFLHYVSLDYPYNPTSDDKTRYKSFIHSFSDVLPCEVCRDHFKEVIKSSNFSEILESKNSFFRWVVDIHNMINKKNGKSVWSYKKALYSLINTRDMEASSCKKKIFQLFLIFLVLAFCRKAF